MTGLNAYIIAGEPSGDRLGGVLMQALAAETDVTFHGVGGMDMTSAGLTSRFDMGELTVMGISEVLPRLRKLLARIRETADDVVARRPDVLITIDSPDFCLRVAARARKSLPELKVVHYVAPSVWAWRPGRAAKMARHVNHVLALLPFEPPYMEAAGMTCDFVGHPIVSRAVPKQADVAAFRLSRGILPEQKLLLLAPGSRRGEIRRLGPDFVETVRRLRRTIPDLGVICPVAETVHQDVTAMLSEIGGRWWDIYPDPDAEPGKDPKALAFAAADAALCASGTVTLEVAAAGTPMVAAYRTTWLTAAIVRRLVKVNSANLVNLVSGANVVPEFIQERCEPQGLADALMPLLSDAGAAEAQRAAFADVMEQLGRAGPPPEARAAASVLTFLAGEARLSHDKGPGLLPPGPQDRYIGKNG